MCCNEQLHAMLGAPTAVTICAILAHKAIAKQLLESMLCGQHCWQLKHMQMILQLSCVHCFACLDNIDESLFAYTYWLKLTALAGHACGPDHVA